MTVASWITAIVVVGIGLFIVGYGRPPPLKIIAAGIFTGVGVAGMHYTGMAAMQIPATSPTTATLVVASVVIAVVAATVALWFTVDPAKRPVALSVAALIMGVAVNGMHFTGMFAMRVSEFMDVPVTGIFPVTFLAPISLFVILVIVVLLTALLNRSGADAATPVAATRRCASSKCRPRQARSRTAPRPDGDCPAPTSPAPPADASHAPLLRAIMFCGS